MHRTIAALLILMGCAHGTPSQLTDYGFEHGRHALRIAYASGRTFAGPDWRVDNLRSTENGPLHHKNGPAYNMQVALDIDNDGQDESIITAHRYELRLVHRRTPGLIWLSHAFVSERFAENALAALARIYVDGVAGAGIVVSSIGRAEETRYATRIVSEGPRAIDGHEAYHVVFEVADVDQLQLSSEARWRRAELLLVRSGYMRPVVGRSNVPTILIAGHENLPQYFDTTSVDFTRFASSIDFRREELSPEYAAVAGCTRRDAVRLSVTFANGHRYIRSPDLSDDAEECVEDSVSEELQRGFLFLRTPYVVSEPPPVETSVPDATPETTRPDVASPESPDGVGSGLELNDPTPSAAEGTPQPAPE